LVLVYLKVIRIFGEKFCKKQWKFTFNGVLPNPTVFASKKSTGLTQDEPFVGQGIEGQFECIRFYRLGTGS
jgi:hypothetical protein